MLGDVTDIFSLLVGKTTYFRLMNGEIDAEIDEAVFPGDYKKRYFTMYLKEVALMRKLNFFSFILFILLATACSSNSTTITSVEPNQMQNSTESQSYISINEGNFTEIIFADGHFTPGSNFFWYDKKEEVIEKLPYPDTMKDENKNFDSNRNYEILPGHHALLPNGFVKFNDIDIEFQPTYVFNDVDQLYCVRYCGVVNNEHADSYKSSLSNILSEINAIDDILAGTGKEYLSKIDSADISEIPFSITWIDMESATFLICSSSYSNGIYSLDIIIGCGEYIGLIYGDETYDINSERLAALPYPIKTVKKGYLLETILDDNRLRPDSEYVWFTDKETFILGSYGSEAMSPANALFETHRNTIMPDGNSSVQPPISIKFADIDDFAAPVYLFNNENELYCVKYGFILLDTDVNKYKSIVVHLLEAIENESSSLIPLDPDAVKNAKAADFIKDRVDVRWFSVNEDEYLRITSIEFNGYLILDVIIGTTGK